MTLDRNHETAAPGIPLAGLAVVYSMKPDLKKLGPVLIEARDITRARYGNGEELTWLAGNQTVGSYFINLPDYSQAERPPMRDCVNYWVTYNPGHEKRFVNELRLAVCLFGQKKFTETKGRLITAYNGLKPRDKPAIPTNTTDLGWIIEQVFLLRRQGPVVLANESALIRLQGDPLLRSLYYELKYDLKFPADPFAP